MKKILLVEDEEKVAAFIKKGLEEEGFQVSVASDGKAGLKQFHRHQADLMILDIILPGMSGLEVCQIIRASSKKIPVLMLTALGTTENVVKGLNTGADDYIVKPFKFEELLARINALTRRVKELRTEDQPNRYEYEDIRIDDDSKQVTRSGNKINLTATEYKLLLYLLNNAERVLSRERILNNVWGIDFDLSTNVVDVYINYLRKKVDRPPYKQLIQTVIGMGYVLRKEE